jgi:tripartite ATP-independent transporter DctP family solute receptor
MKRRIAIILAVTLIGVFTAAATAWADKLVFRINHTLDPTSHYHKGLLKLDELLKEKTKGDLSLDIYHSSQLGSERDAIEGVSVGTLEMTLVSSAPLANFTKAFMVFDLPFIIKDRKKAYAWMDGPEGKKILDSVLSKNMVGLSIWENGFRNLTNSKRGVVKPEDVKGLKIRLMENAIHLATFKLIGAYPTPIPMGELFTALQQKTVDGQENPLVIIYTSKLYEVQKYLTLSGHFYAPAILLINKEVWDKKMSAEQRSIMTECVALARDWERNYCQEVESKMLAELKSRGMEVAEPDKALWAKALAPVYAEFEPVIGKAAIDSLLNSQK